MCCCSPRSSHCFSPTCRGLGLGLGRKYQAVDTDKNHALSWPEFLAFVHALRENPHVGSVRTKRKQST